MDIEKLTHIIEQLPKQIESLNSSLQGFESRLKKLEETVYDEFLAKSLKDKYIPIDMIVRELGISKRKLFYMKERMEIEIISLGRHLYVRDKELDRVMEEHTVKIIDDNNNK